MPRMQFGEKRDRGSLVGKTATQANEEDKT